MYILNNYYRIYKSKEYSSTNVETNQRVSACNALIHSITTKNIKIG